MNRPFILGLTGSIGMGKSTTAAMFADEGVPVWDADAVVHRLYGPGQPVARVIGTRFPQAIDADGRVDRPVLRALAASDPAVLDWLNALVHPLTASDRSAFIAANADQPILVLNVPLLFETGADALCDAVLVVTASPEVQRARVLDRGISEGDFSMILGRQSPDAEKRARADYTIETLSKDQTRAAVRALLQTLKARHA